MDLGGIERTSVESLCARDECGACEGSRVQDSVPSEGYATSDLSRMGRHRDGVVQERTSGLRARIRQAGDRAHHRPAKAQARQALREGLRPAPWPHAGKSISRRRRAVDERRPRHPRLGGGAFSRGGGCHSDSGVEVPVVAGILAACEPVANSESRRRGLGRHADDPGKVVKLDDFHAASGKWIDIGLASSL